ncbi:hypothetical protein D9D10_13405 [Raoultella ornithinolytica]|nr:hypothetical protein D9D10_13405 [Raoultella ornithinolytica]
MLQRANAKGIFLFIFVSWVIIEQYYHNNEMAFLFDTSQLMNIETMFYFIDLLYSGVKKQEKQWDSRDLSPLCAFSGDKLIYSGEK